MYDGMSDQDMCLTTKAWLESQSSQNWLMVIDDLIMSKESLAILEHILPVTKGRIIITTSCPKSLYGILIPPGYDISVSEMELDDARTTFYKLTGSNQWKPEDLEKLLHMLGYIPLAIRLAAGYIRSKGTDILDYMDLFHKVSPESKRLDDGFNPAAPTHMIEKAWRASFEQLEAGNQQAVRLLQVMSFISPDNVPKYLFITGTRDIVPDLKFKNRLDYDNAVEKLLDLHFITVDRKTSMYRIPSKVSDLSRRRAQTCQTTEQSIYEMALACVSKPLIDHSSRSFQIQTALFNTTYPLLPYGATILAFRPKSTVARGSVACTTMRLQFEIGKILYFAGRYEDAKKLLMEVHEVTATAMSSMALGMIEKDAGFLSGALHHFNNAIHELNKDPEPTIEKHELFINKANTLRDIGSYEKANAIYEEYLKAHKEDIYDHVTVYVLSCYGRFLSSQGKSKEALEMFHSALKGYKVLSEKEHGSVDERIYYTLACIAQAHQYEARIEEAICYYDKAIQGMRDLHREEHPKALVMILARAEAMAVRPDDGGIAQALEQMIAVLEKFKKTSTTSEHTLSTRHRIGVIYSRLSNHDSALFQFKEVLQGRIEREKAGVQLPIEYYLTLWSQADVYKEQERYNEANEGYVKAGNGLKGFGLPTQHPHLFRIRLGKAELLHFQGDYRLAKKRLMEALEDAQHWYGKDSGLTNDACKMLGTVESLSKHKKRRRCFLFDSL
jgi:tetratricopeptide (TPR) repeat protein